MRLAIYQSMGQARSPAANLTDLETVAKKVADAGVDLLVLPELWLSGYNIGTALNELAQTAEGDAAQRIARIAMQRELAILYGYPERDGDHMFNAARFIGADGVAVANMRKVHLYGATERALFRPGDTGFPVVEYRGLQIGMAICYDIEFPEVARALVLRGADLIVVPTALFSPYEFVATHVVPVRAWENQLFIAYANRCGREGRLTYVGRSGIHGPDGRALAIAEEDPAIISADIDPKSYGEATSIRNCYLRDRRVDLFTPQQTINYPT